MKRSPLVVLNFGEMLTDELKHQIEDELNRTVDERRIKLAVNALRLTYPQVLTLVDSIELSALPTDTIINVPKLSIGAVYLVNEFFARTGVHPIILELTRASMDSTTRRFGTLRNLELEVMETRRRRSTKVVRGESAKNTESIEHSSLVILNFGEPLNQGLKMHMEEMLQRHVDERAVRASINSAKFAYSQVLFSMDAIDLAALPVNVVINVPRSPLGAIYLVNEFFARTGSHPTILELVRDPLERKVQRFGTLRNLELAVKETRRMRRSHLVWETAHKIEKGEETA